MGHEKIFSDISQTYLNDIVTYTVSFVRTATVSG